MVVQRDWKQQARFVQMWRNLPWPPRGQTGRKIRTILQQGFEYRTLRHCRRFSGSTAGVPFAVSILFVTPVQRTISWREFSGAKTLCEVGSATTGLKKAKRGRRSRTCIAHTTKMGDTLSIFPHVLCFFRLIRDQQWNSERLLSIHARHGD